MDKPEWALRYLVDLSTDHGAELERWQGAAVGGHLGQDLSCRRLTALQDIDLASGLVVELAREAKLFVRARMPLLATPEASPLLLHTMQHFVRFHADINVVGKSSSAGAAAFRDFDRNRPLFPAHTGPFDGGNANGNGVEAPRGDVELVRAAAAAAAAAAAVDPSVSANRKGKEVSSFPEGLARLTKEGEAMSKVGARLMAGLSQLRPLAPATAPRASEMHGQQLAQEVPTQAPGFLDLWAVADARFLKNRLSAAIAKDGSAWHARSVRLNASTMDVCVGELAALVGDLFELARERAECLASAASRAAYSKHVFEGGLNLVTAAVRGRWNEMTNPLREGAAGLLIETLEELCHFLDSFPLAVYFVAAVDEANALRLSMLDAMASSIEESVCRVLCSVDIDTCLFSFVLAPELTELSKRLRPSLVSVIARRLVGRLGSVLLAHLLQRQFMFKNADGLAIFVANCRGDLERVLTSVLGTDDLKPMHPLWGGCSLLITPTAQADEILKLAQIQEAAQEERLTRLLAEARAEELALADVVSVLLKRPDLRSSPARGSSGTRLPQIPWALAEAA